MEVHRSSPAHCVLPTWLTLGQPMLVFVFAVGPAACARRDHVRILTTNEPNCPSSVDVDVDVDETQGCHRQCQFHLPSTPDVPCIARLTPSFRLCLLPQGMLRACPSRDPGCCPYTAELNDADNLHRILGRILLAWPCHGSLTASCGYDSEHRAPAPKLAFMLTSEPEAARRRMQPCLARAYHRSGALTRTNEPPNSESHRSGSSMWIPSVVEVGRP